MREFMKRSLALLLALILSLSLLPTLTLPASAATVNYVTGYDSEYGTIIKNWGTRGTVATFLSPNAEAFYDENNVTYEYLSSLSGASSTSAVPSSALYQKLRSIVTSNQSKQTSYDDTKKLFKFTDCQGSGITSDKISSFYSGMAIGPSWDGTWNREHTWPNSKGDANGNGENDIMMLRPTSTSENSSRGNKAYGEGSSYYNPNSESGGKYDLRGDVARIMLYVYTRWGTQNMWGTSGVIESKEVLLKWMAEDPVDTWELGRNDSTESFLGTRNVYVDYPELAFLLFNEEIPADLESPSGEGAGSAVSYTITAISNNTNYGTVTLNGKKISAFPKTGYYIAGYTVTQGQATVTRDGDVFIVAPQSDCTVRIDFAAKQAGTYSFVQNGETVSTNNGYVGDTLTLPAHTGTAPEGYTFQGWVTSRVTNTTDKPATIYAPGTKYTFNASVTFYALYSWFESDGGTSQNGLYSLYSEPIQEGSYLIVYGGAAMNTTVTSNRLQFNDVTITDDSIYQPDGKLIWQIEKTSDGYYTLYNQADRVYAASTGAKNQATVASSLTENAKWSITQRSGGLYKIVNMVNNGKGINDTLQRNANYGFGCYSPDFATGGGGVYLYKLGEGTMHYATAVAGAEETEPTEPTVPEDTEPTEPTVPETEPIEPGTESELLDFFVVGNRESWDINQQTWKKGRVTVVNEKAENSNEIVDASAPARFYKNSKLSVFATGMVQIVFNCNSASYATALHSAIPAATGVTVELADKKVTVTFDAAVDSFVIASLSAGQVRMDSVEVFFPVVEPAQVPGDFNGDDAVTNDDVIMLMWNILFPDENPITGDGDLNHDGSVTNADVILLMWHVLFPEENPL